MTLSTHINLLQPIDPERIFGLAREAIGIPHTQPFEMQTGPGEIFNRLRDDVTMIRSQPGGYDAMLWLTIVPDGDGDFADGGHYYCGEYPDEECTCRRWYAQIDLDTAYGHRPCCTCLHYGLIRKLAPNLGRFEWQDEYTGIWYEGLPPERCTHHGGVLPAPVSVVTE